MVNLNYAFAKLIEFGLASDHDPYLWIGGSCNGYGRSDG